MSEAANQVKRGDLALIDQDWVRAAEFYEQALNLDPQCAQAYVGKLLSSTQCRDLDEYVRLQLKMTEIATPEEQSLQKNFGHIQEKVRQFTVEPYLPGQTILNMYEFDLRYKTFVPAREWQLKEQEQKWDGNRNLHWAAQFADEEFSEQLKEAKQSLLEVLQHRLAEARSAEATVTQARLEQYLQHLEQTDGKLAAMHEKAVQVRQEQYDAVADSEASEDVGFLRSAAQILGAMGDYRDSARLSALFAEKARTIAASKNKKRRRIFISVFSSLGGTALAVWLVLCVIIPSVRYNRADTLVEQGRFDEAVQMFRDLEDFRDSKERVYETRYEQAESMEQQGQYEEAIRIFEWLDDYEDSQTRIFKIHYKQAEDLLEQSKNLEAAMAFAQLGSYKDARQRSIELWRESIQKNVVDTGFCFSVALCQDRSVVAKGYSYQGSCNVSAWTDVVEISAGTFHTVGLKADGTVVADGDNDYGQCNVGNWTDIISVAAGGDVTMGLRADGTVVAVGDNTFGLLDVDDWTDIVSISVSDHIAVGLKMDGTVVAVGQFTIGLNGWTQIVAVSAGDYHVVGLKADGTVVTAGSSSFGQCDTKDWSQVAVVYAGPVNTYAIKKNGTVLAVGDNEYGQCDIADWTDVVAVSAEAKHVVGILKDGTAVAIGDPDDGKCSLTAWENIMIP